MEVSWKERVDELISWFQHPKTPINFGMLYIEEPDFHGHGIGINSDRFNSILEKLDSFTEYLHGQLKKKYLTDINVVHLSDHGMATVTLDRIVNLTKFIDSADYTSAGTSPVVNIFPHEGKNISLSMYSSNQCSKYFWLTYLNFLGKELLIFNKLKRASELTKGFDVYLKNDIPASYHFSNNPRIGAIIVVAKVGYAFQTLYDSFPYYIKKFNITGTNHF